MATQIDTAEARSPLDDMVCFALYAAARATNRRYLSLLAPWNLTYPQYLVLVLLWSQRSLTVGEIAENLHLDTGTTSPLVRRLEQRGFIQRNRVSIDERVVTVSLTDEGMSLRDSLAHIPGCIAAATQLDEATGREALTVLHEVTHNLDHPDERTP